MLYDLANDIGESKNVAADHEALVKEMTMKAAKFDASLKKNTRPAGKLD